MEISHVDIDILITDPDNARKHDEKNIKAIIGSLKKFDQVEPLVVRRQNNVVIGGNGRLEAMKKMGMSEVSVHYVDLDDQKAKALALALNRTSELATWDDDILGKALQTLQEDGFDIADIGFDVGDWDTPEKEGLSDPDEIPEVAQNVRGVLRGQIWRLGEHRMMCGDSTSKEDVERLMNGEKADMVFTDPPYGINAPCDRVEHRETFKKQGIAKNHKYRQIEGDQTTEVANKAIELMDADCLILWGGNYYDLPPSPCWIVWDKRVEENQSDLNSDCELAWVKHKHKASVRIFRHLWKGMIRASEKSEARVHPTQKPIALAEWCFENYGNPKSVVDLFLGSGSTLIACEKTNRKCYGLEIDPHYCSVIIERWEKFSGKIATLAAKK